jgi:1,4-dihydroxy-6-naphthoate synthase
MPALERGEADLGVCIHEGRFTYAERGLKLVEDLGLTWERLTHCALPLGGLFARERLGPAVARRAGDAVAASLDRARGDAQGALVTMRRWAQEQSDAALWKHVELYVTDETRRLGPQGRQALRELSERARAAGLCPGVASFDLVTSA